ncbi:DUF2501 domain-containing protein [Brytella acorum]|uniref:DUF2501 domain-containing protein n=1 Tax=Brytella acorum TaxID=2959299 RepID=A0AA35UWP9_9PROT|nr:DUF2501 domain-containing protein [Brytella acorum]MDF3625061.1 DUF2501 domain-containing protein [Brytella acorum]CAI9121060.1 DUF2501 domain-containing protein [Brytella acorum]
MIRFFAFSPRRFMTASLLGAILCSGTAFAQTGASITVPALPPVATVSTPGALGPFGVPLIDHADAGNVAGLLAKCISADYYDGTAIRVAARTLAARADVQNDPWYAFGGTGLLQTGSAAFDINSLDHDHRGEVCAQLKDRAYSLISQ